MNFSYTGSVSFHYQIWKGQLTSLFIFSAWIVFSLPVNFGIKKIDGMGILCTSVLTVWSNLFKLEISIDNDETEMLVVFQASVLAVERHFVFLLSHVILSQQDLSEVLVLHVGTVKGKQEEYCWHTKGSTQQRFKCKVYTAKLSPPCILTLWLTRSCCGRVMVSLSEGIGQS